MQNLMSLENMEISFFSSLMKMQIKTCSSMKPRELTKLFPSCVILASFII